MVSRKPASKPSSKPRAKGGQKKAVAARKARAAKKKPSESTKPMPICQPCIMGRNLTLIDGPRHARRPSNIARSQGMFNGPDVGWPDSYEQPDTWATDLRMPQEAKEADLGWKPGPVVRALPTFKGPTPGPTDTSLDSSSSVLRFFNTQITEEFVNKVVDYTVIHCQQWRAMHTDWRKDVREVSVKKPKQHFKADEFYLWLACRLCIAQMKPELNAYHLWDRHSSLFDVVVFSAMTYNQFQWINRHLSFADIENIEDDPETSESDDDEDSYEDDAPAADRECCSDEEDHRGSDDGEDLHTSAPVRCLGDSHRKRRELTDLACKAFAAAWQPHQYLGIDEAVRAHRHWGKQRIRHKAAVHSGSLVDCMNDCVTKYTMWFEEQRWIKRQGREEDPNQIPSRLLRAASVLCPPGEPKSTGNYCISLDRGYGHVEGQQQLAKMGVYTNAVMAYNRVGLPRNYLAELAKELTCPKLSGKPRGNDACTHDPDIDTCRKACYTILHKLVAGSGGGAEHASWELSCWQDSKLIVTYTNFFSSARCGLLARGGRKARESYNVWAPEPVWHYNVQGRSATDGADQLRKKMCIAERRTVRAGVKGINFVFDIAFTNAAIMWQFVHRETVSRAQLEKKFTKVSAAYPILANARTHPFLLSLAGSVLSAVG